MRDWCLLRLYSYLAIIIALRDKASQNEPQLWQVQMITRGHQPGGCPIDAVDPLPSRTVVAAIAGVAIPSFHLLLPNVVTVTLNARAAQSVAVLAGNNRLGAKAPPMTNCGRCASQPRRIPRGIPRRIHFNPYSTNTTILACIKVVAFFEAHRCL